MKDFKSVFKVGGLEDERTSFEGSFYEKRQKSLIKGSISSDQLEFECSDEINKRKLFKGRLESKNRKYFGKFYQKREENFTELGEFWIENFSDII